MADAISHGAAITTVNLAEVLSVAAARGTDPAALCDELVGRGLLHGAIRVEPFTVADAVETARLPPSTRAGGLSLADRACLAVAHRLGTAVLTADRAWHSVSVGVEIIDIRAAAG